MEEQSYWKPIGEAVSTSLKGASITFKHLKNALKNKKRGSEGPADKDYFNHTEGIFTLKYPKETLPTPENGRYTLHNEIDDCIVCDKCAKICPVDCIDIEPIKSTETIGHTSDGTAKRLYAAKFDIDMAKCCFCGLCTTVCPTECLTMTPNYDFSTFEIGEMNFEFSEMTEKEVEEKKELYETQQKAKKEAALKAKKDTEGEPTKSKPAFRRPAIKAKPAINTVETSDSIEGKNSEEEKKTTSKARPIVKRPAIKAKPIIKPPQKKENAEPKKEGAEQNKPKPVFRPRIRPKIKKPTPPPTNEDSKD